MSDNVVFPAAFDAEIVLIKSVPAGRTQPPVVVFTNQLARDGQCLRVSAGFSVTAFYADLWPRRTVFSLRKLIFREPARSRVFVSCFRVGYPKELPEYFAQIRQPAGRRECFKGQHIGHVALDESCELRPSGVNDGEFECTVCCLFAAIEARHRLELSEIECENLDGPVKSFDA